MISDRDAASSSRERKPLPSGQMHEQRRARAIPGLALGIAVWVVFGVGVALLFGAGGPVVAGIILLVIFGLLVGGFAVVQPSEARVLILFGRYNGSVTEAGLWWCNPFNKRKKVSLRVRNFQSDRIKVNDASGNPIEIAAVVVWRIVDTARAMFDVADHEQFVSVQSETSLRRLASEYPYDDYEPGTTHGKSLYIGPSLDA